MSQINVPCYSNLIQIFFHPFPPFFPVTMAHVMDFLFCKPAWSKMVFTVDPWFILGATLLILAVTSTLKQSVIMYKATKQWQPNWYMEQLMGDSILYFLAYISVSTSLISICNSHCVLLPLISIIWRWTNYSDAFFWTARNIFFNVAYLVKVNATGNNTWVLFLTMLCGITQCPMMPRFIISVRELYDRDPRRDWEGVDTGFGVLSQPIAGQNGPVSAIAFADIPLGQDDVEGEPIQLELLGDNTRQVWRRNLGRNAGGRTL